MEGDQESEEVHRIAFGSCNRQNRPQDFWRTIASHRPSHFLWLGDAVYTRDFRAASLAPAYGELLNNTHYREFAAQTLIDGSWDDHDFGVNDGDRHAPEREQRQREFVRFLERSGNTHISSALSSLSSSSSSSLSQREGVYHSLDISLGAVKAKAIFLDARYFRDAHVIPSLGGYKRIPLSALFSSALRGAYSVLGFARKYNGAVLGKEQWRWLEETLRSSDADIHLLVSGVQVATSNPVFESWGHFPQEKQRLLDLLAKYDPRGLVLLSGDVHLSELSVLPFRRQDGERDAWMEVTSSGLTHTCATSTVQRFLCPIMMKMFSAHRFSDDAYYTGRNFGLLEVSRDRASNDTKVVVSVMSVEANTAQLGWSFSLSAPHKAPIERVEPVDFLLFSLPVQFAIYSTLVSLLCVLAAWMSKKFRNKSKRD